MCDWIRASFSPDVFWVMATALFTLVLVLVAWKQLRDLARTSRSDFLYRLKKDFFTGTQTEFIFLLENDLLVFRPVPFPRFDTTEKNGLKPEKDMFTTEVVDNVLLGPLEDVGVYWQSKSRLVVENEAIHEYVDWLREQPGNEDLYDHLYLVYRRLKEETPKIRKKKRAAGPA